MREREWAYGAREAFSHNFDFFVVHCTNSGARVRYCYVTLNKTLSQLIRNWANK